MARRSALLLAFGLLACAGIASARLYECPEREGYAGCKACRPSGRRGEDTGVLYCDHCHAGYELNTKQSRRGVCDCAAGYAPDEEGVCTQCPEGTHVATGGPLTGPHRAKCLMCPKGTVVNKAGTDCLCPAGHYKAAAETEPGYKHVACRACEARGAYIAEAFHSLESCDTCRDGLVAHKNHTLCVEPSDPDAAPLTGVLAAVMVPLNTTWRDVRQTAAAARQRAEEVRSGRFDKAGSGVLAVNPLRSLAGRVTGARDAAQKSAALVASVPGAASRAAASPGKINLNGVIKRGAEAVGSMAPRTDYLGALTGKLDPNTLEEAGLPRVNNVVSLLGNVMGEALRDVDKSDWTS